MGKSRARSPLRSARSNTGFQESWKHQIPQEKYPPFWKQTPSSCCFFLAEELVQGLSHLRFNIHCLYCVFIQPLCIDFHIKMANITHYGIILHLLKVPAKKKSSSKLNAQRNFSSSAPEDALVCSSAQGKMKSAWLTDCIWLSRCVGLVNFQACEVCQKKTLKLLGKNTSQGYKRLSERKYVLSMESKTGLTGQN